MKKSKFTSETEAHLILQAPKKLKGKFAPEHYIKGNGHELSKLKFLNMTVPDVRRNITWFAKKFPGFTAEQLFAPVESLWFESDIFEAKSLALIWLTKQSDEFLIAHHKPILKWVDAVDNWAHSDTLCSVLARLFEKIESKLLPTYKKWNRHKNSWHRRCSMVGIYNYSYFRAKPAAFALAKSLVEPHFTAPEYYVQKAVGWTIREMYNVYPAETIKFIKNNLNQLTSIAWVAASEKLPDSIKQPMLKERKLNRKK